MNRQLLKDQVFLRMAIDLSDLGTCTRRKVGTIFVDSRHRILASGYNGPPPGDPHCTDSPCIGAQMPSGTGLDLCEAIHAEQNAILQCTKPDEVHTVYCTTSPCIHCVKMIAGTGCKRIVFASEYPHSSARDYWSRRGGSWDFVSITGV
jgi:dCMP deaminase